MFGYSRDQLLESPIERLIPERFRPGHAQLRSGNAADRISRAMGAGRELFGQRTDGSEFPIEIGINVLQTLDGVMVIETIVDISVRKGMERMLQKTVGAAPYGMVMIHSRGRIVLVNPQTEVLFGYAREELIGQSVEMLLPERSCGLHGERRAEFTAVASMRQMGAGRDLTARRKDGTEFLVEVALNPVPSEEGGLVLAAVTDITSRRAMELEWRQANTNLEEFSYAASHDMKSPLKAIADLVDWIIEDLGSAAKPEVTRNPGRVTDRIGRLNWVIDD